MKNYIITLLLAAMSLNTVQATGICNSDTLIIPAEMAESCDVYTSEDGNMSFYVWGGCHEAADQGHPNNIACRIKTSDGSSRTFLLPEDDEVRHHHYWITGVHSIKKNDGTTFYIVPRMFYFSTTTASLGLDAFAIVGDTIEEYEDIPSASECSNMNLEKIDYDTKSRELYIPITPFDIGSTGRYTVYKFNGISFVEKEGSQPSKGLHSSLHQYEKMLDSFTTKNHLVRIDMLENGKYRYASWNLPASISDKPDLVLESEEDPGFYRNGDYSYIIEETDDYREYLVVKHKDKILVKEEVLSEETEMTEESEIRIPYDIAMLLLPTDEYISEDGNIKISNLSWGFRYRQTNAVAYRIKTSNGGSKVIIIKEPPLPSTPASSNETNWRNAKVSSLHSLKKNDGSTYYIICRMIYYEASGTSMWMEAFVIENDTIKSVSVYDGSDDLDDCGMDATFNNYAYWDLPKYHLFEYNPKSRELYVPQVIDNDLTDRYWVYYFNGDGFVKRGLQPHKGLHNSLHQYKNLVMRAKTDFHLIRIDRLEDGSLRYASWNKELQQKADISKQPDIILYNGVYNEETNEYTFRNGNFSYTINNNFDYLVVKYNGKEQTKYRIYAPYE